MNGRVMKCIGSFHHRSLSAHRTFPSRSPSKGLERSCRRGWQYQRLRAKPRESEHLRIKTVVRGERTGRSVDQLTFLQPCHELDVLSGSSAAAAGSLRTFPDPLRPYLRERDSSWLRLRLLSAAALRGNDRSACSSGVRARSAVHVLGQDLIFLQHVPLASALRSTSQRASKRALATMDKKNKDG